MIKYICDRCKQEVPGKRVFTLEPHGVVQGAFETLAKSRTDGHHICIDCLEWLFREPEPEPAPEPPKKRKGGNREGIGEKVPLIEKARMDELTGKKKKRYYLTEADKAVISERYAKGDEMDAIAEDLGVALPPVSVYIAHEGLGEERYKGQAVPDHGGQPVMPVTTGVYKVKGGR